MVFWKSAIPIVKALILCRPARPPRRYPPKWVSEWSKWGVDGVFNRAKFKYCEIESKFLTILSEHPVVNPQNGFPIKCWWSSRRAKLKRGQLFDTWAPRRQAGFLNPELRIKVLMEDLTCAAQNGRKWNNFFEHVVVRLRIGFLKIGDGVAVVRDTIPTTTEVNFLEVSSLALNSVFWKLMMEYESCAAQKWPRCARKPAHLAVSPGNSFLIFVDGVVDVRASNTARSQIRQTEWIKCYFIP